MSRGWDVTPKPIENPDADLPEYKVMHDAENLYAYFRARAQIGRTQKETEAHKRNAKKVAAIKNSGRQQLEKSLCVGSVSLPQRDVARLLTTLQKVVWAVAIARTETFTVTLYCTGRF